MIGRTDAEDEYLNEAVADTIDETYINESGERVPIPDVPERELGCDNPSLSCIFADCDDCIHSKKVIIEEQNGQVKE